MNPQTERVKIAGPVGALEVAVDRPAEPPRGVAVVCHPHPLHGGTMDNKVAQTLARAFVQLNYVAVRFNYRGVGASEGGFGDAIGETDDALAIVAAYRDRALPLALAGFSFGGFVAANAASRLPDGEKAERIVLVGPSTKELSVPAVPEDTLVIHGETDDVVPLSATLDWARPQVLPVVVVPGVGHFFHGQLTLLKNLVINAWRR
jgi:alpha/beta superfamily hydrolase